MNATCAESISEPKKRIAVIRNTAELLEVDSYLLDLEEAGYEYELSLQMRKIDRGTFDLVMLWGVGQDIADARRFVEFVQSWYPGTPLLVLTLHGDPKNIHQFAPPPIRVISRPMPHKHLLQVVDEMLNANAKAAP